MFHALPIEQHHCLCHIFWSRGVYKTNHWAFSFSEADKHSRMTILSSSVKNIIAITEPVKCSSVITYLTQSLSFAFPLSLSLSLSALNQKCLSTHTLMDLLTEQFYLLLFFFERISKVGGDRFSTFCIPQKKKKFNQESSSLKLHLSLESEKRNLLWWNNKKISFNVFQQKIPIFFNALKNDDWVIFGAKYSIFLIIGV